MSLHDKTLRQLRDGLQQGDFSSRELTQHFLDRINALDGELNSFITVTAEQALAQADAADQARASGNAGVLNGVPIAHKDIFCTRGVRTSCASRMLDNFVSPRSEEHTSELQSRENLVCRLLLEKKKSDDR